MQHHLDRVVLSVVLVALGPVVAYSIGEDGTVLVEGCGSDAATNVRVALETVLGVLVPEVECSIGTSSAECAMDRVERNIVDGVDIGDAVGWGVAMTLEREVGAAMCQPKPVKRCVFEGLLTWSPYLRRIG